MKKTTAMHRHACALPWVLGSCSWVAAVLPASAQPAAPPQLDQSTLIDRLADEGMGELLEHLVATDPPRDPIVAAQVEIAAGQLRYRTAEDPADRAAGLEASLQAMRDAIAAHRDHPQRPVWQTDFAELLLTEYLTNVHQHASEFYEFGVPTPAQRAAFESAVAEAFVALAEADLRFGQLQSVLPREPDYREKYVRTGLEQRFFEDYHKKRTRFYLGLAAHLTTLLPDTHPYFTTGSTPAPGQRPDAAEEKTRLRELALDRVLPFTRDALDAAGVRLPSMTIVGRVQLGQRKPQEALASFQPVIEAKTGNVFELIAQLGAAEAQTQQGQFNAALTRLEAFAAQPLVRESVLLRLLVTDAMHRVGLAQAEKAPAPQRDAARAAAYDPYVELFDDPALGEQAEALKNYVYLRWQQTTPASAPPASLAPVVRLALGEIARIEGQNLAIEAQQQEDEAKMEQARERLARAIALNETLGNAPSESVRARATFNLALAQYYSNPNDLQNLLDSTALFVKLADELPAQPESAEGMRYAMGLLRELHGLEPQPPGVDGAYQAAAKVLFEKYASEPVADDERLYYGYFVLVPAERYAEAADVLGDIPTGHRDYFVAQREMLFALEEAMRAERDPAERTAAREELVEVAERVHATAGAATDAGDEARGAAAAAELVLAGAALDAAETAGEFDPVQVQRAMQTLDGFEQRYAGLEDLIRLALERRVMALAAGQQLDRLGSEAREMMSAYPDAAAYVIDRVLTNLDEEIADLRAEADAEQDLTRQRELRAKAEDRAKTASALAEMLVGWARDQGYNREEMLPYQLVLARSRLLAGQPEDALAITRDLSRDFGESAEVLHQHAEALFATGREQNLLQAAPLYDRLIGGLTGPPYPALWWNAWMRRLQINDQLGKGVEDIAVRVRQLKLTDPNLGGPPYNDALQRLAEKHGR